MSHARARRRLLPGLLGACLLTGAGIAGAHCPESLPVALLEECLVAEGLGKTYPVEAALAAWRKRHPGKRIAALPGLPPAAAAPHPNPPQDPPDAPAAQ